MAAIKAKPGQTLLTVTPANRDGLPQRLLALLQGRPGAAENS